jgi:hypothetical protein
MRPIILLFYIITILIARTGYLLATMTTSGKNFFQTLPSLRRDSSSHLKPVWAALYCDPAIGKAPDYAISPSLHPDLKSFTIYIDGRDQYAGIGGVFGIDRS